MTTETKTFTAAESAQLIQQIAAHLSREGFLTSDDFAGEVRRVRERSRRAHEIPATFGGDIQA